MGKELWLILGGNADRERLAVRKVCKTEWTRAGKHPVWISGPALTDDCVEVCKNQGCDVDYLRVDYKALDTLSNFTTLVEDIKVHRFEKITLVSSAFHIRRGEAIASVILPAYNAILSKPSVVISPQKGEKPESILLSIRDLVRAWLWRWFGFDVTFPLVWLFHRDRIRQRDRRVKAFNFSGPRCFD